MKCAFIQAYTGIYTPTSLILNSAGFLNVKKFKFKVFYGKGVVLTREHSLLYSKCESGKWHMTSLCSAVFFTFTLKFYCYRFLLLMFRETLL